jgi:hypothetical protein
LLVFACKLLLQRLPHKERVRPLCEEANKYNCSG